MSCWSVHAALVAWDGRDCTARPLGGSLLHAPWSRVNLGIAPQSNGPSKTGGRVGRTSDTTTKSKSTHGPKPLLLSPNEVWYDASVATIIDMHGTRIFCGQPNIAKVWLVQQGALALGIDIVMGRGRRDAPTFCRRAAWFGHAMLQYTHKSPARNLALARQLKPLISKEKFWQCVAPQDNVI